MLAEDYWTSIFKKCFSHFVADTYCENDKKVMIGRCLFNFQTFVIVFFFFHLSNTHRLRICNSTHQRIYLNNVKELISQDNCKGNINSETNNLFSLAWLGISLRDWLTSELPIVKSIGCCCCEGGSETSPVTSTSSVGDSRTVSAFVSSNSSFVWLSSAATIHLDWETFVIYLFSPDQQSNHLAT